MPTKTTAKPAAAKKSAPAAAAPSAAAAAPVRDAVIEPDVLPEPIVTWQPTHSMDQAPGGRMTTTTAVGYFILGAVAVAAVALGAIAIDRATRD